MRRFVRASVQALHKREHRGERSRTPALAVSLQTLECRQLFAASVAAEPIFSDNNSNSADDVTATFFKAGHYLLNCTVTDQNSLSTTSQVLVDVTQTATSLRLSPHARIIHRGGTQQNVGGVYDQFGKPMASQPRIRWFIQQGPGEIDTNSGFYTATGGKGHLVLEA
jgi:hypothetical protein